MFGGFTFFKLLCTLVLIWLLDLCSFSYDGLYACSGFDLIVAVFWLLLFVALTFIVGFVWFGWCGFAFCVFWCLVSLDVCYWCLFGLICCLLVCYVVCYGVFVLAIPVSVCL